MKRTSDRVEIRERLFQCAIVPNAPNRQVIVARLRWIDRELERDDDVRALEWNSRDTKFRRCNANDGVGSTVQEDRSADYAAVGGELASPETIAEHHRGRSARLLLLCVESAADRG